MNAYGVISTIVIKHSVYEAKAKAKTFMRCPRGSSRPRPGLENNKTGYKPRAVDCSRLAPRVAAS